MSIKAVINILSDNFADRFKEFIESENIIILFINRNENLTDLIMEALPPIDILKAGASGESSENTIFEGILMYCIINLFSQKKIPGNYIDNIIQLVGSFFSIQKLIPVIQIDAN